MGVPPPPRIRYHNLHYFLFISQTWDLLRLLVHGFLSFCKCFFFCKHFTKWKLLHPSPESKLQCIGIHFQHAKAHLWWKFISYRLWPKKSGQANKYSEKAYRDVPLKIFFSGEENATHETVTVPGKKVIG